MRVTNHCRSFMSELQIANTIEKRSRVRPREAISGDVTGPPISNIRTQHIMQCLSLHIDLFDSISSIQHIRSFRYLLSKDSTPHCSLVVWYNGNMRASHIIYKSSEGQSTILIEVDALRERHSSHIFRNKQHHHHSCMHFTTFFLHLHFKFRV